MRRIRFWRRDRRICFVMLRRLSVKILGIAIVGTGLLFLLHPGSFDGNCKEAQLFVNGTVKKQLSSSDFRWTHGRARAKKTFSQKWTCHLERFGLDYSEGETTDEDTRDAVGSLDNEKTVIVTAVSSNHFDEALEMLDTITDLSPESKPPLVYVYNIGLEPDQISDLISKFGHLIILRQFNFSHYPSYVSDLSQYRWKPLIVAEVMALTKHNLVWWFDSSVRIRNDGDLGWYLHDYVESRGDQTILYPLVFTHYTSHSIFPATEPSLYDYFPVDQEATKRTNMYGATVFAVYRRRLVQREILKWWVLCALEEDCMAPPGSALVCRFAPTPNRDYVYADCHRYDQSVLNILVAAANNFNDKSYYRDKPHGAIQVERTG